MRKPYIPEVTLWQNENITVSKPTYAGFLSAVKENKKALYKIKEELNIQLDEQIVLVANIYDSNGKETGYGYRLIESGNIADCLVTEEDVLFRYYINKLGNLCATLTYENGHDDQVFRVWKPGISKQMRKNFLTKVCEGKVTTMDLWRYTASVGEYIQLKKALTETETAEKPKDKRKKYATEEERKAARREQIKRWKENNRDKDLAYKKKYNIKYRERQKALKAEANALKAQLNTATA